MGSQFTCSEWPSGSSKCGGEGSLSPLAAGHAVPSAWGLPSPQPCWTPGGPSPLAAAPAELRAGCLVQGNLGCLHLSPNARFHSGPLAHVHRGAGCPPLSLENQRVQLEGFSGVLSHPRPRVTVQAQQGTQQGNPAPHGNSLTQPRAHRPRGPTACESRRPGFSGGCPQEPAGLVTPGHGCRAL